ncbi:MAG: D-alanine--D-alanine ligase, partial [Clostridia bacterium]|nr:D-alanine--D-alanine ligase [Clostridia bacterium]
MRLNVAVLFGGKSTEHEISVISAIQAMENMDPEKYEIHPVYITKANVPYTGAALRDIQNYRDIPSLLKKAVRVAFVSDGTRTWMERASGKRFGSRRLAAIDVAFPIVHGTNVEDGTLQGFLRLYNLPVVGCDVLSSAVGMDKYVMKQYLAHEGFPVLPGVRLRSGDYADPDA